VTIRTYEAGENVCVVGAGASGLAATKNLVEHGFGVDCYERETGVGGLWNWRHERSPVTAGTHPVSSRPVLQFPDFPMPDSWPDYPHHGQVLSYLESYADHFDLRRHIWLGTEVMRVAPAGSGQWDVTTRSTGGGAGRTRRYAAVVVANGHHWSPKLPDYQGMDGFTGEVVHAGAVSDPAVLRGRRVLVVGGGNSGCDLAVEAAQRAATCWHSTRRGYWYLPKYLAGRPVDQATELMAALRLPRRLRQWRLRRLLRLTIGDPTRFGVPAPDHRPGALPPVVNSHLLHLVGHGRITPVPDVARFHPDAVELVDGATISPDLVVLATGYLPRFDFLTPDLLDLDGEGRPHLPLHLFTRHQTLAVAGLPEPDSGGFGVAHWQTVVVARWLRLWRTDPDRAAAVWPRLAGRPGGRSTSRRPGGGAGPAGSTRHWFRVGRADYLRALARALDELESRP
jgi:hypothetical protein